MYLKRSDDMPPYLDFYNAIDDIAAHLRTDFIGLVEDDEVLETEEPISRYFLGILWAKPKDCDSEDGENSDRTMEEMFEDESKDSEEPKNISVFKPSAMGVSFAAGPDDILDINFTYAIYLHSEKLINNNDNKIKRHYYARKARQFQDQIKVPDKMCNKTVSDKENSDVTIFVHVRRVNDDGSRLVTVSVLNRHKAGSDFIESNEGALFRCVLSIKSSQGFVPVYRKNTHRSFEEEKNDMLYETVNNYSYGHGCSSVNVEDQGRVTEIRSEFIPQYRMLQMMPRIFGDTEYLYMDYWNKADRNKACSQLDSFIGRYREWYVQLKKNTALIEKYPDTAADSFEKNRTLHKTALHRCGYTKKK